MEFNRIIKLLRKERGITQKQAAEDLGVSQALLSHYEKGIRECGLDFVVRVADYYNVSCDYLLGNHMEIPVQAMDTTSLEVGLSDRICLGNSTLYLRLAHRQGMGWMGAQKESPYSDGPKTRYKMWLVDMDYKKPFTLGRRPASWSASFHGQWNTAGNRLYGVDMVSIGNRYTVWGFDGEYTLMGESGWYLRNELASSIPRLHSEAYVGLDVGLPCLQFCF